MNIENLGLSESYNATVTRGGASSESVGTYGVYHVECFDSKGNLKWSDKADNLVTTLGKNLLLDNTLTSPANSSTVYLGLKGTGTAVIGDTMSSHANWVEVGGVTAPTYTAPRKTLTFSAASGGVKASSSTNTFAITGTGTVAGCFLNINGTSAIDNTTGLLFSAGDFLASKSVTSGDTIAVTYSLTLT